MSANERLPSWSRELAIMDEISAMAREGVMADDDDEEPECLAGPHCLGCGLKNCPVDEKTGELNGE